MARMCARQHARHIRSTAVSAGCAGTSSRACITAASKAYCTTPRFLVRHSSGALRGSMACYSTVQSLQCEGARQYSHRIGPSATPERRAMHTSRSSGAGDGGGGGARSGNRGKPRAGRGRTHQHAPHKPPDLSRLTGGGFRDVVVVDRRDSGGDPAGSAQPTAVAVPPVWLAEKEMVGFEFIRAALRRADLHGINVYITGPWYVVKACWCMRAG